MVPCPETDRHGDRISSKRGRIYEANSCVVLNRSTQSLDRRQLAENSRAKSFNSNKNTALSRFASILRGDHSGVFLALASVRYRSGGKLYDDPVRRADYLQTPHLPPSFAQCRQYLQFLHALQGSLPVHVAAENISRGMRVRRLSERNIRDSKEKSLFVVISRSFHRLKTPLNRGSVPMGTPARKNNIQVSN
jgi:hypothetical protein